MWEVQLNFLVCPVIAIACPQTEFVLRTWQMLIAICVLRYLMDRANLLLFAPAAASTCPDQLSLLEAYRLMVSSHAR